MAAACWWAQAVLRLGRSQGESQLPEAVQNYNPTPSNGLAFVQALPRVTSRPRSTVRLVPDIHNSGAGRRASGYLTIRESTAWIPKRADDFAKGRYPESRLFAIVSCGISYFVCGSEADDPTWPKRLNDKVKNRSLAGHGVLGLGQRVTGMSGIDRSLSYNLGPSRIAAALTDKIQRSPSLLLASLSFSSFLSSSAGKNPEFFKCTHVAAEARKRESRPNSAWLPALSIDEPGSASTRTRAQSRALRTETSVMIAIVFEESRSRKYQAKAAQRERACGTRAICRRSACANPPMDFQDIR